jgi:hypothetical protein
MLISFSKKSEIVAPKRIERIGETFIFASVLGTHYVVFCK